MSVFSAGLHHQHWFSSFIHPQELTSLFFNSTGITVTTQLEWSNWGRTCLAQASFPQQLVTDSVTVPVATELPNPSSPKTERSRGLTPNPLASFPPSARWSRAR